jgi:hypothetical protein
MHLHKKNRIDGSQHTVVTSLQVLLTGCLLPTPTAGDAKSSAGQADRPDRPKAGTTLTEAARGLSLLPTPTASDGTGAEGCCQEGGGVSLPAIVTALLPTPTAHDEKGRGRRGGHRTMAHDLTDVTGLFSLECLTELSETTGPPSDDMPLF